MGALKNFFLRLRRRPFFYSRNIKIHKSSKISRKSIVRIVNGGSIEVGKNCELLPGVILMTYGGVISIGDNCSINPYTIIYGHGNTSIGSNVLIAGHCMIIPANHNYKNHEIPIQHQGLTAKGIVIEDDVWIGNGCSILDGVTIGAGSVVAAGSVVTKSISPNSVVGGVPAKLLKIRGSH
jgi:acetyltransferase-like isoleucine patch superfamily enzyme